MPVSAAAAFAEGGLQEFGSQRRASLRRDDFARQHTGEQFDVRVASRNDADLSCMEDFEGILLQKSLCRGRRRSGSRRRIAEHPAAR